MRAQGTSVFQQIDMGLPFNQLKQCHLSSVSKTIQIRTSLRTDRLASSGFVLSGSA